MKRKRVTELFPGLLPLRKRQRVCCFYAGMSLDGNVYAKERKIDDLPWVQYSGFSLLYNQQTGFDMKYQENKVFNLRLAAKKLDGLGLIMSKRDSAFTVGKFALGFNALLYTAILILFDPEVAIYSVIYNFANSMILDRMHQQNVTVQALIFTREDESVLADFIIKQLGRSVTYWDGVGAYTKDDVRVLCVCLSKYEIEELLHMVHSVDPHAFLTVQEGVRVFGNFPRKLG